MCFGSTVFTGSEAILCFLTHLGFVASPQYQAKVFLQWLCAVKEMVKPAPHSLEACLWRHSLWTKSEPGSAPQVPTVTSKQGHFCVCGIHSGGEDSATEQRKELNASTTYAKKPSTFISAGMHQQAPLPHDTETRAAGPMLPSPQALPKYYVPPRLNGVRVLPYLTLQSEILSAFHEAHLLWNSPSSPLCLSLQQMRSCWRVHPWVPSPCCYTCQMAATAQ